LKKQIINELDIMAKKIHAKPPNDPTDACVCVEIYWPGAKEVCVAGSFNDWQPDSTPMSEVEGGLWKKELALKPGCHEYRFVVDGNWVDDPKATEWIPNQFGTANAVLRVEIASTPDPAEKKNAKLKTKRAKA
jgi:1,4-alpha-glucan branching enzyme